MSLNTPPPNLSNINDWNGYYHPEMVKSEKDLVEKRRNKVGIPKDAPQVGVALSGGGIRSATFCLGVFQSLAVKGFLEKIDFLSTVSGGGYFGSFLGRLFDVQTKNPGEGVKQNLLNPLSAPIRWLREHGRYLSPHGPMDNLVAGLVYFRNWAAVQSVIISFGLWLVYCVLILAAIIQMGTDRLPFPIPVSSLLFPVALVFILWLVPAGIGYWLCQGEGSLAVPATPVFTILAIGAVGAHLALLPLDEPYLRVTGVIVFAICAMTILFLICFWGYACCKKMRVGTAEYLRTKFTEFFIAAAKFFGLLVFLFLLDALGNYIYEKLQSNLSLGLEGSSALVAAAWAFLSGLGKKISGLFTESSKIIPKLSMQVIAGIAAFVWLLALLIFLTGVAEVLAWGLSSPDLNADEQILLSDWPRLLEVFSALTLLCVGLGRTISFLNYSSNHPFYKFRLVNAYLGAANSALPPDPSLMSQGNDVWMKDYTPHAKGGPLHLINVTINETVDGKSQVEERDRKGVPLAVGPAGLSVGLKHSCLWGTHNGKTDYSRLQPLPFSKNEFHVFEREAPSSISKAFLEVFTGKEKDDSLQPVEYLSLGAWFSISGAAFTTGLGAKTSVALSSLLGLANIRLGYWWNSHVSSSKNSQKASSSIFWSLSMALSRFLPVQFGLLDELTARFHGTARQRWYLSDGGHFENTATYELIRRRVPFIVVCDDGQDVNYGFEDLAGMVLKARNDFQAEIVFFGPKDIQKSVHKDLLPFIGSPQDFKVKGSQKHALLAWVEYLPKADGKREHSLMLILKPSLSGDEPMDLMEYHLENPDFPQETTMNQFFTEAQWEAYRKLGEHIAGKIFSVNKKGKGWTVEKGNDIQMPEGI